MIRILHLYPDLMNMYGDYGNIVSLSKHLIDQGLKVKVDKKDIDDDINFDLYDFIYMGSGTISNQKVALKALMKHKKEIIKFSNDNKVILFTGNSMELLGNKIDDNKAIGLFDFNSINTDKRYTGDVIVRNNEVDEIVGFINKSSVITNNDNNHLFEYVFVDNNLKEDKYEGYRINNTFATQIIGPILVKNPNMMNYIVRLLMPRNKEFKNINYQYEENSYQITLNALKGRMK